MHPKTISIFLIVIFPFLFTGLVSGQSDFELRYIELEGLKKCKPQVVLRELPFMEGDQLNQVALLEAFQEAEDRLRNTGLFSSVELSIGSISADNQVDVKVEVVEAWYPYLIPVFELADRNFNVWFVEYNHDFKRTNYGLHFYHYNVSGRGDRYELLVQQGFTHKYETEYYAPFLSSKNKDLGLFVNALYTNNSDLNYATVDNQQLFHRDVDRFLFSRRRLIVGLENRNSIYLSQGLTFGFYKYMIDPYVENNLNADFLLGRSQQRFFTIAYNLKLDKRDERPYPMAGYYLNAGLVKEGIGVFDESDNLSLRLDYKKYQQFSERLSLAFRVFGDYGIQRNRPSFFQNRLLGYQDRYIRGYEYYVVDGLDALVTQADLRFKLFDRDFNWGKLMFLESYRIMPYQIFVVPFLDMGYARDPWAAASNTFNERFLPGYGIGVNFRLYYDKVFRFEWSRNVLGEMGFYLHWDLRV